MRADKLFITTVFVLVLLFSLSILVRIPTLDRPLSNHHEWLTAHALRNHQIWFENGIETYGFLPVMTYNNDADRNINNAASITDSKGNYYYVSYPPFSYFLPYFFFRLLNIYPDVLPLQIFNLGLHLINCCLIFLLVAELTGKKYAGKLNIPAVVGFGAYLFSPETLWFHSNAYFADTLVQTFFILGIYLALKYVASNYNKKYLLPFGAASFLMAYTEWIGGFFVVSIMLYALFNRREKALRLLFYAVAIASILAVLLTVWHYSQINGLDSYANAFTKKYLSRSAVTADEYGQKTNFSLLPQVFKFYAQGYGPMLIVLAILFFVWVKENKKRINLKYISENKPVSMVLFLSALPVLMHHVFGINFTISHDFSVLKTSVLFSVGLALLYDYCRKKMRVAADFLIGFALIASLFLYLYSNVYVYTNPFLGGGIYQNLEYKVIGLEISKSAGKDEAIFIKKDNYTIVPQLIFYAHRNIALWEDDESAKNLVKLNNASRGIVFVLNENATKIQNQYYIESVS